MERYEKETIENNINHEYEHIIGLIEGKPSSKYEVFSIDGRDLLQRVKQVIKQANVVRIAVVKEDKVLIVLPIAVGAVTAVLFPYITLFTLITLLYRRFTLVIERREPEAK